ncbi:MAG TPA: nitrite/sulfite reductase [Myxococcota bacterium]|nr:nitrite/sulfite reductase [Myxococcota bacterium]
MAPEARVDDDRWEGASPEARRDIEVYAIELGRWREGKIPDAVFTEFRLRHGVYGQRQDGVQMQRIKIPLGILRPEQLEAVADVAEEYALGVAHVTTRQDFQIHFVDIRDTPELHRRLAKVGVTTREACGNTVRNVTGCPLAGVCRTETFDVTPYARATAYFLLKHPDAQSFGRKFKIAFSGCAGEACGLALMHDIGCVARVRAGDGGGDGGTRGFEVWVGGGLGAIPYRAKLFSDFVPAGELLPLCQAIARVFARLGEKKARSKARMKFLVDKLGLDGFRALVLEEVAKLPPDEGWTAWVGDADRFEDGPLGGGPRTPPEPEPAGAGDAQRFRLWCQTSVAPQRQPGFAVVTVFLPLGDISARQLRGLADVARRFVGDNVRLSVTQNMLLRWVPDAHVAALWRALDALGLAGAGAHGFADVTACPGTDSCKLGITSSRGLAAVLAEDVRASGLDRDPALASLSVKMSGCPNSCGQHHIADIGFFGSSLRRGAAVAPVFQLVLGGSAAANAEAFGLGMGKVPAKNVPAIVHKLSALYLQHRRDGERMKDVVSRLGKQRLKDELGSLMELPEPAAAPDFFTDWRQPRPFHLKVEAGECAGELIPQVEFLLTAADRQTFEAGLHLEAGRLDEARAAAFAAMKTAADALLTTHGLNLSDHFDTVAEFRPRFVDAGLFYAPYADYFFKAAAATSAPIDAEHAHQCVEEATLFVEEGHVAYSRMRS